MTPIAAKFAELKTRSERALILYVTAGDPSLEELPQILDTLVEGGADLVEIGLPYSDPVADGPIIQASTQRALERGVNPSQILRQLQTWDKKCPVVAMGYYNTVLRLGLSAAAQQLSRAGVGGTILSDLTPEESDDWRAASGAEGLENIFLAAPTSTDERLARVAEKASGFLYAVSRTGVTGSAQAIPPEASDLVRRLKALSELPVAVGFGISTPAHVRMVSEVADGVVIGSWLVDLLARTWQGGKGRAEIVEKLQALKFATRGFSA